MLGCSGRYRVFVLKHLRLGPDMARNHDARPKTLVIYSILLLTIYQLVVIVFMDFGSME